MATVHNINQVLAEVRGTPLATIEAYSRVLRRDGVLPRTKRGIGATMLTSKHAALMLAAVMRGSPSAASENAREIGGLIAHSEGGALMEPVLKRQLQALRWSDGITFSEAVAWLIDRYCDGTIGEIVKDDEASGWIEIKIDKYWTAAWLRWFPTKEISHEFVEGYREAFADLEQPPLPERKYDGTLVDPMMIKFHSPLLHEMKVSYLVDAQRNREVSRQFIRNKEEALKNDVWGNEWVTQRTLAALSRVFKKDGAH